MTGSEQQDLEQELSELDSALRQLRHEDAHESDELTHLSQHPADVATELTNVAEEDALIAGLEGKRNRVVARLTELRSAS